MFLGMSAGVGKTYAMLKAAHQKAREGFDVVIGVVETHNRRETAELLEGLEVLPRKKSDYRGTQVDELDLEAVLRRRPDLVVVDELAHTNAPGSRHEKRYQDVLEILEAGIGVYTALNVQHLESRKDSVEAITGIPIRETVPDSVLERAALVELVDIAPTELLKRLKEGKVYLGDQAERAAQNFFREDKLTALREIALRMTAERVDQDLQRLVSVRTQLAPWQTNERLLVCISHSPYSEKLIRATRRLAYNLEAPWVVLHVDTGLVLNDQDQAQLVKNLKLASDLKAEVITTIDTDVPTAVRRICRQKNVTQVVVGRPTRRWFRQFFERGNLLQRLVNETLEVDIHVIRQEGTALIRPKLYDELSYYRSKTGPMKYWTAVGLNIAVGLIGWAVEDLIGYRPVGFFYLLIVIAVGLFGSIGAVIFAATLSAFVWDYFFIPPKMTLLINNADDVLMVLTFFGVALITGFLTHRIRFHERLIRDREERTNVLFESLQDIAGAQEKSEFLKKVADRVGDLLGATCGVLLKTVEGKLAFNEEKSYSPVLSEKDQAVAQWSYEHLKSAGWSTDTLAEANSLFVPLKGGRESVGVFVFQPHNKARKLDLDKRILLRSIASQLGLAIERHFMAKRIAEAKRLLDAEKLHQTLLNSISHEMKTPLTTILGSAAALEHAQGAEDLKEIGAHLHEAGDRLNRVIENLLDMGRLNSGVLALKLEWHDLNDLVHVSVKKNEKTLMKHRVEVEPLGEIPLARIDVRLMEHAITNLLVNAAMYSPPGSGIKVRLKKAKDGFSIEVQDEGPGIPEESVPHIFEKFYRVPGSPTGGTGLGLSIVKTIVELHGGSVEFENQTPHGTVFRIDLVVHQTPQGPPEETTDGKE
ncbi:MAG: two-component sensor histidine kinase [Bdellovibrio sp.]|nr:MAG: two-component sensor histidine kinase [Bdellovibrio sp.]